MQREEGERMSMITELIYRLRYAAKDPFLHSQIAKNLEEAASTIEELSAKLHASQMDRSSQYYHGGWIPCEERLPEDFTKVMVTLKSGAVMEMLYRMGEFVFVGWNEIVPTSNENPVLAWRPLPEPYREEG